MNNSENRNLVLQSVSEKIKNLDPGNISVRIFKSNMNTLTTYYLEIIDKMLELSLGSPERMISTLEFCREKNMLWGPDRVYDLENGWYSAPIGRGRFIGLDRTSIVMGAFEDVNCTIPVSDTVTPIRQSYVIPSSVSVLSTVHQILEKLDYNDRVKVCLYWSNKGILNNFCSLLNGCKIESPLKEYYKGSFDGLILLDPVKLCTVKRKRKNDSDISIGYTIIYSDADAISTKFCAMEWHSFTCHLYEINRTDLSSQDLWDLAHFIAFHLNAFYMEPCV